MDCGPQIYQAHLRSVKLVRQGTRSSGTVLDHVKQASYRDADRSRDEEGVAQGAHASIAFLTRSIEGCDSYGNGAIRLSQAEWDWIEGIFTKICVRVDSEQDLLDIVSAAEAASLACSLIQDSGLTEFGGIPTYTCCAIGPDDSDKINEITGNLKLL